MQYNQTQLRHLEERAAERIQEILELFKIDGLKYTDNKIVGNCPVHSGDKNNAFNGYLGGHTTPFHWKCRTRGCHQTFRSSVIGLVRGLLSKTKHDWTGPGDKTAHFMEAVNWLESKLRTNLKDIKEDSDEIEKMAFARTVNLLNPQLNLQEKKSLNRAAVRERLEMPCQYFLGRGFSEALLNKYDIGTCTATDYKKPMYGRAVVPVYDENHEYLVGCTGRSLAKKECELCGSWHLGKCPPEEFRWQYSKWRHDGFSAERCLFNLWYARRHIQERGTAVLVESPGNILKLESIGVPLGLASFGAHFTPFQELALTGTGCLNLVIIPDPDKAGLDNLERIKAQSGRNFNIYPLIPQSNDLGGLTDEQARELVFPLLLKLKAI